MKKKKYRLNKVKFKQFIGNAFCFLVFGAMGFGLVCAILLSPEW